MKSTCLVADKDGTEIEVKKGKVDADKCIKDYNLLKKKQEELELRYNKLIQV